MLDKSPAVSDSWAELVSQDVVAERLLFYCRLRVGVDVEEEHSVSLHVACCSEVVGDLLEQSKGCLEFAGFIRFNSVLLSLVSNYGEGFIRDRERVFLTLRGELGVCKGPRHLVVDVEVGGLG